jgi:serine/threonine protein kinase
VKKIGSGGYGTIYHASNSYTNEEFAIKIIEDIGDVRRADEVEKTL